MEHKPTTEKQINRYTEDEIDLIPYAKELWGGRKNIIKTTILFTVVGLFVGLSLPAEYTCEVIVKPNFSTSDRGVSGNISGLAAIAGINIDGAGSTAEIHPMLYPKIIESYNFQKELMESPIYVESLDTEISFEKYYSEIHRLSVVGLIKKYTLGLPGMILNWFSDNKELSSSFKENFNRISETDEKMMRLIEEQLQVGVDKEEGFVSLSATMPEKLQATQLVVNAKNILQRKVIAHKLKKAQIDLEFIEERFMENKLAFEQAQSDLAKYIDANKNVNTATAQTEVERLQSEYELAFSVYSEIAKQVESQKIQVKKNTPVFIALKEAVVPLKKSSTPTSIIILMWSMFGFFTGVLVILGKYFLANLRKKWSE